MGIDEKDSLPMGDAEKTFKKLAEKEVLSEKVVFLSGLAIGLFLIIAFHALWTIFRMLGDNSIPLVVCPRSYDLDAPVVMDTIDRSSVKNQDRWMRGFMRRFIINQFPRTEQDVEPFFQYIVDHSEGAIQAKFESYVNDSKKIGELVRYGTFYRFYPKNSTDMRIRKMEGKEDLWVVEVDGWLVRKMGAYQERFTPTLRYIVRAGAATLSNPEGLYVIDGNMEEYSDYVSGKKEQL